VIIVAGACGVAAGTPLAILAGIGSAARRGIIVKGRLYLEKLADIDTMVFDKTGTLTMGIPEVTGIRVVDGAAENEVLLLGYDRGRHSRNRFSVFRSPGPDCRGSDPCGLGTGFYSKLSSIVPVLHSRHRGFVAAESLSFLK